MSNGERSRFCSKFVVNLTTVVWLSEIIEYSLHDQICQARYSFPDCYWSGVSNDGKDLIKRLLTLDPKKRISSTEALEHPWMQDEEVVGKARKIMEAAARNVAMPPPPLTSVRNTGFFSLLKL